MLNMHLTFSWVQFLSNKLEFFVSCNIKIRRTLSFCSAFVHFYENLIVLHHGDNNFLFYFDMCIKFTRSTKLNDEEMITSSLISALKQLFMIKKSERKKTTKKPWQNIYIIKPFIVIAKFRVRLKALKG